MHESIVAPNYRGFVWQLQLLILSAGIQNMWQLIFLCLTSYFYNFPLVLNNIRCDVVCIRHKMQYYSLNYFLFAKQTYLQQVETCHNLIVHLFFSHYICINLSLDWLWSMICRSNTEKHDNFSTTLNSSLKHQHTLKIPYKWEISRTYAVALYRGEVGDFFI